MLSQCKLSRTQPWITLPPKTFSRLARHAATSSSSEADLPLNKGLVIPKLSPCIPSANAFTSAKIFWDLDNVRPSNAQELQLLGKVIVSAVYELSGAALHPQLTVFANPTTFEILSSPSLPLEALVAKLNGQLVLTTGRKQSVDLAMRTAMLEFAQTELKKKVNLDSENPMMHSADNRTAAVPLLACVSDDADFVQILDYLRSLGCTNVSVGEHKGRKRPAWAAPKKIDSLPLPAVCNAAISLKRPVADENGGLWSIRNVWINPKFNTNNELL